MVCSLHAASSPAVLLPRRSTPSPSPSSFRCRPAPLAVSCSAGSTTVPFEPLKCQPAGDDSSKGRKPAVEEQGQLGSHGPSGQEGKAEDADEGEEKQGISGIYVPRQKYISTPKGELLDGILSMFESKEDADSFLRFAKCLDLILHADHKDILEQMRIYYPIMHTEDKKANITSSGRSEEFVGMKQNFSSNNSFHVNTNEINGKRMEKYEKLDFYNVLDLRSLFGSSSRGVRTNLDKESRLVATRFQHTFMELLRNAQFEELSAEDLLLSYALNTDYLLTLPIYVDWKRASESNAVIFRRGYATERQKGLLIIEKLDYLQSKLLLEILINISRPLKRLGIWVNEVLTNSNQTEELKILIERSKAWLKKQTFPHTMRSYFKDAFSEQPEAAQAEANELPFWLAAQRAAPRYEGFLSSIGPRGRLMRKFLMWIGFIPSIPEASEEPDAGSKVPEAYLRPNFLPRITLTDIWKPASRKLCGNNVWKMIKTGASILFSRSILLEPAFQELILLYTEEMTESEAENIEVMPLQLKIYERIPYPDLPVIFPHKKLSFRILDTVRLDVASILGLLAYFVNYKFENILSSPSAIFLDVVAISALILYVTRVALGYKQTWDRYQLLVNRTLYEKTLASGFGSIHFLLDASEQQQYKEAILAYAILLHAEKLQLSSCKSIGDACERFMYNRFNEKVEMPIEKAMDTLLRLDIVREVPINGNFELKALPCLKAYEALRHRWDNLLS